MYLEVDVCLYFSCFRSNRHVVRFFLFSLNRMQKQKAANTHRKTSNCFSYLCKRCQSVTHQVHNATELLFIGNRRLQRTFSSPPRATWCCTVADRCNLNGEKERQHTHDPKTGLMATLDLFVILPRIPHELAGAALLLRAVKKKILWWNPIEKKATSVPDPAAYIRRMHPETSH